MNNNSEAVGGIFGTALSAVGASMSVTEVQAIVSIIATGIGLLITIITTIIIPVIKKFKAAKADGKIDKEEAKDIIDTVKDGLDSVKDKIDENK